ncbi:MAG: type II toxin-antitoxin system RelE/ParE family toxin [Polaromonas sp.]|nr:type II toxin-antitoxin system RelE/ParE family toxin [Polaromonas sp.]
MAFQVIFKPLAQLEASEAFAWYDQSHIGMGKAFLTELEHTSGFLSNNPYLYPRIEQKMRRANLNRFPYSLFYVIDDEVVFVLSCFHQHREPKSRDVLLR